MTDSADPAVSRGNIRRLAKNAGALALGGVIAQAAYVVVEALIGRRLGPDVYGIFSTVYVITLTVVFFIDGGMTWKMIQDGSRDATRLPVLLGTTLVLKSAFFVVVFPVTWLIMQAAGYSPVTLQFFTIFFFYALIIALQESLAAVYSSHQRMEVNALYQAAAPVLICALVVGLVRSPEHVNRVAWSYIGVGVLITAVWAAQTFRTESPRVRLRQSGKILRGSYLYGLTGLLSQMFFKVDTLMLSLMRDMSEVGIYAAGYRLLDLAYKIPILGARVVSPLLFKQSQDDQRGFRALTGAVLRGYTLTGCGMSIVIFLLAGPIILAVFGPRFAAAILILQILSISFAIKFVSVALETMLTTADLHQRRTVAVAVATTANIALNLFFIPRYGAVGAAVSTAVSDGLLVALYVGLGRVKLPVRRALRLILVPAAAALVCLLAARALPLHAIWQSAAALAGFAAALFVTGYISLAELRYAATSLRRS